MGKLNKNLKMKVIIAFIALLAMQQVMTQVPMKWVCCEANNTIEPKWATGCGSRRLQAMVEPYCPTRLTKAARRLAVSHPESPVCGNFKRRRLQAIVKRCPVNIGYSMLQEQH